MQRKPQWLRLAAQIRTIWALVAMIPLIMALGLLALATVVLTTPITLAGMLRWHWKDRARASVRSCQ